jgi:N utilization substance protein A
VTAGAPRQAMNNELQTILSYMERERGIDRRVLIEAVEFALQSAARKSLGAVEDPRIVVDPETYDIRAYARLTVVDKVKPSENEIDVEKAQALKPDAQVGDVIEKEVTPRNFGRIAAQTAKQAILQRIRQAEREIVFDEYKDRVGDIVSGSVRQFNRRDIIVDLGRAEAVIPEPERVRIEEYQVGDRVRAYVLAVQNNPNGPSIVLTRSHPDFVRRLFELEVSEIADGVVEILGIAREPGFRTKIAVRSKDEKVDPVGACVGMRGIRVKNIVRELSGEKIDIVRYSDDLRTYVANALSPAKLAKVTIDPNDPNTVHVVADTDQLSLAIGKRGQNVRLTSKLLGVRVNIQKDESEMTFDEKVARAVSNLAALPGVKREHADALVQAGFLTVEGILAAEPADIAETAGLDLETARAVYDAAAAKTDAELGQ